MIKYLLSILCFCFVFQLQSQNDTVFCEQLAALKTLVKKEHYHPKPINDSLSRRVHELFLELLDENRRFFTQNDIDSFSDDVFKIDDYVIENDCVFIDKYINVLQNNIEKSKNIISALKDEALDYSGKDTLYFNANKKFNYFKDTETVNRFWNKRMRYDILSELVETDSVFDYLDQNFKALEKEVKPKVLQNQICLLDELLNQNGGLDRFVKESFLNAYMKYHDPNSSFFNDSDRILFESSVANSQLSFGITTTKNDEGDIVVSYITPGSVAFEEGSIEVDDILKSLTSNNEVLEAFCVSNNDVLAFTNDDKHNTILFKVKKQNGTLLSVELTRAETKIEENTIRGYIIDSKTNVGYISIPSFYTDLESPNGLGLANDVAKELYKLDKENIKGLILDLRFNGGGSMKEAADLSGMFINRGPLSILRFNDGETFTVRDANRGSLFKKPIVILMNNFSASASEFFAGVLQDYNRALIVGATSHGKATVQVVLPLNEKNEDLGFSKITIEKFYRVTGKSHQSVGIIPDVMLPSLYDNFKTNESSQKYALANDSIEAQIKHVPLAKMPTNKIQTESKKRILNNPDFKSIKTTNELMVKNYINIETQYPLTLQNVYNEMNDYNKIWEEYNNYLGTYIPKITFKNTTYTNEILQYNDDELNSNTETLETLSRDIYIEEAYAILLDLLNFNPSN